jgi:hypothetical protein
VDGGCLSGPTGRSVQTWDVQPGKTYTVTIDNVTECANGGTDPTLGVRINSSISGNTDIVATRVGPGTYQFDYTVAANAICTMPVFHCTVAGAANSGSFTRRSDGGSFQVHLRAASFGPGLRESPGRMPAEPRALGLVGAAQDDLPVKATTRGHFRPRGEGPPPQPCYDGGVRVDQGHGLSAVHSGRSAG